MGKNWWFGLENGDIPIVKKLIEHGANVNATTKTGSTALFFAAQKGETETVKLLLEKKADTHKALNQGDTPLCIFSLFQLKSS